jgi:hypothetical protein
MTSKTAAIEWLNATFDIRYREAFDHAFRNVGPIFRLKSDMDTGEPMRVRLEDYHDPQRWWL